VKRNRVLRAAESPAVGNHKDSQIGHRSIFLPSRGMRELCRTPFHAHQGILGAPIRAKFTPLNKAPFGRFNGASGPRHWANPKLSDPPQAEGLLGAKVAPDGLNIGHACQDLPRC
jgi:hypothetical protein